MKDILINLCTISAVSGDERFARPLVESLRAVADGVKQLSGGSIVAYKKCGKPEAKRILLDAHLDQIGLMVKRIDDRGFIHFFNHAGVDNKILLGAEVKISAKKEIAGVISAKPPHLLTKEERKKPAEIKDMCIDTGLPAEKVREAVRIGDKIALNCNTAPLLGHCVTGRSLDNRAGCAVLVSVLEKLKDKPLDVDVYVVLSAGEEFGGYGAVAAASEICPDAAIVLDVSHADMPAARAEDCGKLGKGVMIGISPMLDRAMSEKFIRIAEARGIAYQREAMGGATYTNADGLVPLCGGIPVALLSIPQRYMHTPQEIVSLEDMVSVRDLTLAYLEKEGK